MRNNIKHKNKTEIKNKELSAVVMWPCWTYRRIVHEHKRVQYDAERRAVSLRQLNFLLVIVVV